MPGSSKSDNQMSILIYVLAASLLLVGQLAEASVATGSADSNELHEKLNSLNANRNQQQQVIANDLQELQAEVASAEQSDKRQHQQMQQYRQQLASSQHQKQQQQQQQKLVSQGVINGNHATYVEPPADFKPIIYEHHHDKNARFQPHGNNSPSKPIEATSLQSPNQAYQSSPALHQSAEESFMAPSFVGLPQQPARQQQHQVVAQASADPLMMISSTGFDDHRPLEAAASQSQQQQQQQVTGSSGNLDDKVEFGQAEASESSELKPSIGRWSDWHDMSIEPDLASSDTLATGTIYSGQPQYYAMPFAPYKTRYQQLGATGGGEKRDHFAQAVRGNLDSAQAHAFRVASGKNDDDSLLPMEHRGAMVAPVSDKQANQVVSAVKRPFLYQAQQQHQLHTKGGHQASQTQQSPSSSGSSSMSSVGGATSGPVVMLPLNLISNLHPTKQQQQQQQYPKWLQQQQSYKNEANQQPSSLWEHQQAQQQVSGATKQSAAYSVMKQPQQQQVQRRLKRRRKSKANAEVRIQQLVTASQLQQELIQTVKQVNGLTPAYYNPQFQQLQVSDQSTVQQQVDNQRVLSGKQPRQLPTATIVKKLGSQSQSSASSTLQATNSTKPRVIKRRRIKTLLPVGLSSWFLGGIRDLDGRHWKLPAEVVSRLAVNDVDLHHPEGQVPAKAPMPPSTGSVIILSNEASAVPLPASATTTTPQLSTQRVPISQLVPR